MDAREAVDWCYNKSNDLNILSTPYRSPFFVTLMLSMSFPVSMKIFAVLPADKASNNYTFVCENTT